VEPLEPSVGTQKGGVRTSASAAICVILLGVSKWSSSHSWHKDEGGGAVHQHDGRGLYLCADGQRQGQPWGPRVSQSRRFPTREDAQQYAQACSINASARSYEAIRLSAKEL